MEISVRRTNSMASSLPLKCMDFILYFTVQFSSVKCNGSTECMMSAFGKVQQHVLTSFVPFSSLCWHEFRTISAPFQALVLTRIFEHTQKLCESPYYNFLFPRFSNQCDCTSILSWIARVRTSIPPSSLMSLCIDTKMILPFQCSSSHFTLEIIVLWISSRIPVVNPWKIDPIQFSKKKIEKSCFPLIWLVQYWYLPDTALNQKRRRFCNCKLNSSLSVSRVVSPHTL